MYIRLGDKLSLVVCRNKNLLQRVSEQNKSKGHMCDFHDLCFEILARGTSKASKILIYCLLFLPHYSLLISEDWYWMGTWCICFLFYAMSSAKVLSKAVCIAMNIAHLCLAYITDCVWWLTLIQWEMVLYPRLHAGWFVVTLFSVLLINKMIFSRNLCSLLIVIHHSAKVLS